MDFPMPEKITPPTIFQTNQEKPQTKKKMNRERDRSEYQTNPKIEEKELKNQIPKQSCM